MLAICGMNMVMRVVVSSSGRSDVLGSQSAQELGTSPIAGLAFLVAHQITSFGLYSQFIVTYGINKLNNLAQ